MKKIKKLGLLLVAVATLSVNVLVVGAVAVSNGTGKFLSTNDVPEELRGKDIINQKYETVKGITIKNDSIKSGDTYKELLERSADLNTKISKGAKEFVYGYALDLKTKTKVVDGKKLTGKELYEKAKTLYDAAAGDIAQGNTNTDAVKAWDSFMNVLTDASGNPVSGDETLWCFTDPWDTQVKLKESCDEEYYLLLVADKVTNCAAETYDFNTWETTNNGKEADQKEDQACAPDEYVTAKPFKVAPTKTDCDPVTPPPKNPPTGVATPYVIAGVVAIGGIAVIAISKKKKFI